MFRKIFLASFCSIALTACQTAGQNVVETVTLPTVRPQPPQPLVLADVKWRVLNIADMEAALAEAKKNGKEQLAFMALTPDGYRAMSGNLIEIRRYIEEQKAIIAFLQKTLDDRAVEQKTDKK